MKQKMTYAEAAKAALDCQDAVNLSGVVFTFARAVQAVCDEANKHGYGTKWKNTNTIVRLFLFKLIDLADLQTLDLNKDEHGFTDPYALAHYRCEQLSLFDLEANEKETKE